MKIAISSTGKSPDSQVDPRFGRASYFLIFDVEKGEFIDTIDNRAAQEAAHGAGINAASAVAEAGVEGVLTGRVGPKAFAILQAAGIKVISEMEGTVQEVLDRFRVNSNLKPSGGPDCDAHASSPKPKDGWRGGGQRGKGCGCKRGRRAR